MKKEKSSGNLLLDAYKQSFQFIADSRMFIYVVILLFFLFALIGFFISPLPILEERILLFLQELLEKTEGMSRLELTRFIFVNNFQSSLLGMLFGVLLGIFPVLSVISNGYVLGFVASKTVEKAGILVLWRILPHGIFELPALFISLGLGLKLGSFIFQKQKFLSFKEYLKKSILVFLLIVIPLLLLAAIIEGSLIFFFE
jgi:stage II sporulation protein M